MSYEYILTRLIHTFFITTFIKTYFSEKVNKKPKHVRIITSFERLQCKQSILDIVIIIPSISYN